MAERHDLEISRVIGQPVDPNLPVPVAVSAVADVEEAASGEEIKVYGDEDSNVDDIYTVDANCGLVAHKVTAVTPAVLAFVGLNSKLEYVCLDDVLGAEDQGALARKKASITRSMDKEEVRRICAAVLALSSQEVVQATADDLYDLIMGLKHKIEDYGDNYVLLVGSAVSEAIDTYDKDKVASFNYRIGLKETLAQLKIEVIKVIGQVNGGNVLATDKLILVARDSTIAVGKPILFVRRKISEAVAQQAGIEAGVRLIDVAHVPTIINTDNRNTLAYGTFGYESLGLAIVNYRAISWATFA